MGTAIVTQAGNATVGMSTYTWANKPNPVGFRGQIFISDVGVDGSIWYSNGTKWLHDGPISIIQGCVPIGIPSSGSVGANGALTLTTAFSSVLSPVYLFFPGGAVFSGSAAGFYYVEMSSTSIGTIYNNRYTAGKCDVPSVLTPIVAAGPGAYVQDTAAYKTSVNADITGLLGKNGDCTFRGNFINNNSGLNKIVITSFGVTTVSTLVASTATNSMIPTHWISNLNDVAKQSVSPVAISGGNFQVANSSGSIATNDTNTLANARYLIKTSDVNDWMLLTNTVLMVTPT